MNVIEEACAKVGVPKLVQNDVFGIGTLFDLSGCRIDHLDVEPVMEFDVLRKDRYYRHMVVSLKLRKMRMRKNMFINYNIHFILETVVRLILAGILGGIIGYERETENKPAGFRTNMLVCIGSALVMVTSEFIFTRYSEFTNLDPARLGAQVITGIGFIGAGTIIRDGIHVRGLTTAAGLWVVACVGIAAGIGFYEGAIISTVFIYLILFTMKKLQKRIKAHNNNKVIIIRTVDKPGQLGAIGSIFGKFGISINSVEFQKEDEQAKIVSIKVYSNIPLGTQLLEIIIELQRLDGIEKVYEG